MLTSKVLEQGSSSSPCAGSTGQEGETHLAQSLEAACSSGEQEAHL